MSGKSVRVLLMAGERPLKMLLERELPENMSTVVAIQSGEEAADLVNRQLDTSQLDFEVPSVGRIETRHRQREGAGSDLVVLEGLDDHDKTGDPSPGDLGAGSSGFGDSSSGAGGSGAGDSNAGGSGAGGSGAGGSGAGDSGAGDFASEAAAYLDSVDSEFLTRPLKASDLNLVAREAKARLDSHRKRPSPTIRTTAGQPFVFQSQAMIDLMAIVDRVAAGSASILIQGETGTGKTLIAREIHAASPRAGQRFVAINCSAFQEQLLESEIFGHEKGSFTGAVVAKPGLFELADRGTLFLDEVGDMSSAMQAKLLQILDDGELRRVGGTKTRKVDVRIVAASNKDLKTEVRERRFREDLLFRLNVIRLTVPRLAERREDIPALIAHFLNRFRLPDGPIKSMSPEATQILNAYSWPGNVRELANTVEGLMLLAPGDVIRAEDLPPNLRPAAPLKLDGTESPLPLSEIERLHIISALRFTEGKKAPAARLLKIDVKTLSNKIKGYDIEL